MLLNTTLWMIMKRRWINNDTVYKYDSDNPFGCPSSDTIQLKNYVEIKYDLKYKLQEDF